MKKQFQLILSHLRRADQDFNLIQNGDKIAVGVSGGKDSLLLLKALATYARFGIKTFDVIAVTVDCTGGKINYGPIKAFCDDLGVAYFVEASNIFEIIFDIKKEKNPCSLCSKLRRGILNSVAVREGANKVALGHHADDLIETFLLSLIYEGRIHTFQPLSYLDRTNITVIRPLVYVPEQVIASVARQSLPVLTNSCPVNHKTQREYMKNLIKNISQDIPIARDRMTTAISNWLRENAHLAH